MPRKSASSQPPDSEVGYGRPPQHSRFKAGQSGNPTGKRKPKTTPHEDDREAVLSQRVTVTLEGKRVTITKRRLLYHKLYALSMGNDIRAAALLLKLDLQSENGKKPPETERPEVSESEDALIARFLRRNGEPSHTQGGGDE